MPSTRRIEDGQWAQDLIDVMIIDNRERFLAAKIQADNRERFLAEQRDKLRRAGNELEQEPVEDSFYELTPQKTQGRFCTYELKPHTMEQIQREEQFAPWEKLAEPVRAGAVKDQPKETLARQEPDSAASDSTPNEAALCLPAPASLARLRRGVSNADLLGESAENVQLTARARAPSARMPQPGQWICPKKPNDVYLKATASAKGSGRGRGVGKKSQAEPEPQEEAQATQKRRRLRAKSGR